MTTHSDLSNRSSQPAIRFLAWMNLLCLDVVLGAILSALAFAAVLNVELPLAYWVVLALSVWIVYTFDHLVDAHRLGKTAHTRRHAFIFRHFRTFFVLALILSGIDVLLVVWFLDFQVLLFGLVVAALGGIYFLILHFRMKRTVAIIRKEVVVSILYMLGVAGIPMIKSGFQLHAAGSLLLAGIGILVLADVLLFSFFDADTDQLDDHHTLAQTLGRESVKSGIEMLCLITTILPVVMIVLSPGKILAAVAVVLILMSLAIHLLLRFESRLRNHETYRYLAEMVFWLPGLIALVPAAG